MKKLCLLLFIAGTAMIASAQEIEVEYATPTQKVGYLSVLETPNYEEAVRIARQASDSLKTDFSNSFMYDPEEGLIDTTTCGCGEQHGYMERGRFDEGDYVSIELANWYDENAANNVYHVIVLSYPLSDELLEYRISNIKAKYPKAVYFEHEVYTGCMH